MTTIKVCSKNEFIYEDSGFLFFVFEEGDVHPGIEIPVAEHYEGTYIPLTIKDDTQALVFTEYYSDIPDMEGNCGGCYAPKKDWRKMGEVEIKKGFEKRVYTFWDTKIRLPRGDWWNDGL